MNTSGHNIEAFHRKLQFAGMLVAIGIVFGDIGTSPLYTLSAIFKPGELIDEAKALGVLSCVIWTLTLQTTFKYIFITLRADNNGEGGIFSLYALVRRYFGKWLVVLAIVGGSFLVADGVITPPISVSSAVEGLQALYPGLNTVPIVVAILILLFTVQQFGTNQIGKIFGPVMIVWFGFIGVMGIMSLRHDWTVIRAINPVYAYDLLAHYPKGFWLLGGVFLCTTGAEALYSDMGHVGRNNIRISWAFVKITLLFSYAGQTAWLLHAGRANELSPFYNIIPQSIYWPSVVLATLATIIASQALISGCFTLANEAMRMGFWPKHKVFFPSDIKGQIYIPFFNWTLLGACILTVLYFRKSSAMEAAFGLSVTLTMLITTALMAMYLIVKRTPIPVVILITGIFTTVEISFLLANLQKVEEGGWIMLVVGAILTTIMLTWRKGKAQQQSLVKYVDVRNGHLEHLRSLSHNEGIPRFATNLIYLTASQTPGVVEEKVLNSIFQTPTKRADVYWFLNVHVTDEPYTMKYEAHVLAPNDVYDVLLHLGFRVEPKVDLYFRKIAKELLTTGELRFEAAPELQYQSREIGDYKFVITNSFLSYDNDLPFWKTLLIRSYYNIKAVGVTEAVNFEIDPHNVINEKYPLVFGTAEVGKLERIS
jgi:KUP system potassium uptake protein